MNLEIYAAMQAGDYQGAVEALEQVDGENVTELLSVASAAADYVLSEQPLDMATTLMAKCINRVRWLLDPEYG